MKVIFLQDLQDLALNIASLALKLKFFLQDIKILQESFKKNCRIIFSCKTLIRSSKKIFLQLFLARFFISCRKSFILPSKNRLARNIQVLQVFFLQDLQDLALNLAQILKSCTKNEAFLARYKKSCKKLARKYCKMNFLQDLIKVLQENYLRIFSCKILARVFISCKKSFIFSARLARFNARSCKSCKNKLML